MCWFNGDQEKNNAPGNNKSKGVVTSLELHAYVHLKRKKTGTLYISHFDRIISPRCPFVKKKPPPPFPNPARVKKSLRNVQL